MWLFHCPSPVSTSDAQVVDSGFTSTKLKKLEDPKVGMHLVASEPIPRWDFKGERVTSKQKKQSLLSVGVVRFGAFDHTWPDLFGFTAMAEWCQSTLQVSLSLAELFCRQVRGGVSGGPVCWRWEVAASS